MSRTFALIPAAGKSRRMRRPKLGLPLGGRTVLEAVISAVKQGGVDATLVVLGPTEHELRTLAENAGANVLELAEDTAEMRDTIERGLAWLEQQIQPAPHDGWLLLPADHPCVDVGVVRQVCERGQGSGVRDQEESAAVSDPTPLTPNSSIIVPTFGGRRGHPVWISWQHVEGIRALPRGVGLNVYLRQHAEKVLELPVSSESVLWDLDTPEDYERMGG